MDKPHMIEQIIKYSDGTETVIKYRGVIENGILIKDMDENTMEEGVVETPEEAVEESMAEEIADEIESA